MSDGVKELRALHEVPYSNIEGAYVEVKLKTTEYDYLRNKEPVSTIEIRKGEIVGRETGAGLYYDTKRGEDLPTNNNAIYLQTPEDTILEVRTDKSENELLDIDTDRNSK